MSPQNPSSNDIYLTCLFLLFVGNFASTEGEQKSQVKLKCGSKSMFVNLETKDDFSGVIYTRGSFHDKKAPCFLDPGSERGQRSFTMKVPLDECQTLQRDNIYSNVLVLQHDKDLIMPGDTAFTLECDFRQPREVTVGADMHSVSRVMLADLQEDNTPPQQTIQLSIEENESHLRRMKEHTNIVTIRPNGNNKQM